MVPGNTERRAAVAVAITGASGAVYAVRTVAALLARAVHVELVISDYGRRLLHDELGDKAAAEKLMPYLSEKYGSGGLGRQPAPHSQREPGAAVPRGCDRAAAIWS